MHSVPRVSTGKLEFILHHSYLTQIWVSLKKQHPGTAQNHVINPVSKEVRLVHSRDVYHIYGNQKHPQNHNQLPGCQ